MKFSFRHFIRSSTLANFFYEFAIFYPTPANLSYFWNFGFLALVCLAVQIITGIFLAMHYVPNVDLAFASVEHIMRDVNYGYMLRYIHANGASMFFLIVYAHLLKGLYFGSFVYPRESLWLSGVIILFLMIVTAFTGYVLPWGQMSFWAATVITNLVSVIPIVGVDIVYWLWGGFSVSNPTLHRFFSLHYLLPFLILAVVILHLMLLHNVGSNNPVGVAVKLDNFSFMPYFFIKDFTSLIFFFILFSYLVFFAPNLLGHPDNYVPANPLVTPNHIVPEWYFLPFYAILRALPNKTLGVVALLFSIVSLAFLPFYCRLSFRSGSFRPIFQVFFFLFVLVVLILGWVGAKPIEPPYYLISQLASFAYFVIILFIFPLLGYLDRLFLEYRSYSFLNN